MKEFGKANEYYRARLINVNSLSIEFLDWDEDILYQQPERKDIPDKESYQLQIVTVDDKGVIIKEDFKSKDEASIKLEGIIGDLTELTKKEFDDKYLNEEDN